MCILADAAPRDTPAPQTHAAHLLPPQQRQQLALAALAGTQPLAHLAQQHDVSRKFVAQQRDRAHDALTQAFAPAPAAAADVLFTLPVTRSWLAQFVLALVLICHSSLRGVHELLRDLFDYHLSLGAIHNLVQEAIAKATDCNAQQDLSRVLLAALDEIFQGQRPVLTVVDAASTYCCLLALAEHRDADTWGVHLLDLQTQGFAPAATVADGGQGLRAGLALALPDVSCRGDVFHAERDLGALVRFLENRAYTAIGTYAKLQRQRRRDETRLRAAQQAQTQAVTLADDVAILVDWLQQDILAVAGPCAAQRRALFDFVLVELQAREPLCPHRLGPVCRGLAKQKEALLAFATALDTDLSDLAHYARLPEAVVRELVAVQALPATSSQRWQRDQALRQQLGARYHEVSGWVAALRQGVVRASSVVENVHSRVRNYFFLRKEVGQGYLELLRFFLNHRRFLRSEHAERVGRSPAELLGGQEHGHWLELLGYQLFRQAA